MKRNHVLYLSIILILTLSIFIFSGCSPSTTDSENEASESDTQPSANTSSLGIGDSVSLEDVNITLLSMSESAGSEYNKPAEGNVFVLLEFLFENNSSKEVTISSMGNFDAYVDAYAIGVSFEGLYEAGTDKTLDKAVSPGKKLQGFMAYEVPISWQEIEINVAPDFSSSESAQFIIKK